MFAVPQQMPERAETAQKRSQSDRALTGFGSYLSPVMKYSNDFLYSPRAISYSWAVSAAIASLTVSMAFGMKEFSMILSFPPYGATPFNLAEFVGKLTQQSACTPTCEPWWPCARGWLISVKQERNFKHTDTIVLVVQRDTPDLRRNEQKRHCRISKPSFMKPNFAAELSAAQHSSRHIISKLVRAAADCSSCLQSC